MFGIGTFEIVVILIVFLIAVGPRKLPTVMRATGRAVREFRKAMYELRRSAGLDEYLDDADYRPTYTNRRVDLPKTLPAATESTESEPSQAVPEPSSSAETTPAVEPSHDEPQKSG